MNPAAIRQRPGRALDIAADSALTSAADNVVDDAAGAGPAIGSDEEPLPREGLPRALTPIVQLEEEAAALLDSFFAQQRERCANGAPKQRAERSEVRM